MPGMSGIELAHLLHARAQRIPVVLMTAYPDAPAYAAKENGIVIDLLEKPLDGDRLDAVIREALGDES